MFKFKKRPDLKDEMRECKVQVVIEQVGLEWNKSDWAILGVSVIARAQIH